MFWSEFIQSLVMSFLRSCTSFMTWLWPFNSNFLFFNWNFMDDCLFNRCDFKLLRCFFRTFKRFFNFSLLFIDHRRSDKAFALWKLFFSLLSIRTTYRTISFLPIFFRICALSWRFSRFESWAILIKNLLYWVNQRNFVTCKGIIRRIINTEDINFKLVQN